MSVTFKVRLNHESRPFPHYWEKSVGSCHAYMGLREDWRAQLKKCREELGFQYVRFHGILNDQMSVFSKRKGEVRYSFFNIDSIFDFLLSIGMKPLVELSFMPRDMASGDRTVFHYRGNITPPADYSEWGALIESLTRHCVDRYGIDEVRTWYFEVWNEPNLGDFWAGTREEYFRLYQYAAEAVKRVDSQIPVGGPSTSVNAWIPEMLEFCQKNHVPIDFVSTHHYPTDEPLWLNREMDGIIRYERGILTKMAAKAREQAGKLPLFYTEWNISSALPDALHDEPYAAAFITKTIADNDGLVDMYSFWTFSDLFEEAPLPYAPFHGGFGLQTLHGIPKPKYRAFQLLHKTCDRRLPVERSDKSGSSNVELLATVDESRIVLLAYNHNVPDGEIREEEVEVVLHGVEAVKAATMEKVDHWNANPKNKWLELGSPEYPDKLKIEEIHKSSLLKTEELEYWVRDHAFRFRVNIPPHGMIAVTIEK